jgi:hypothetical protein
MWYLIKRAVKDPHSPSDSRVQSVVGVRSRSTERKTKSNSQSNVSVKYAFCSPTVFLL